MGIISVTNITDGTTADAADVNSQINTIVSEFNGNIENANIKSAAAIAGSKLADASIDLGLKASVWDGWIAVSDSWAYASATTITVPTDATTKYSVGDKIKLVQTTTKYFQVTAVAATTLTVFGIGGVTVANAAISGIYYSKAASPIGYDLSWQAWTPTLSGLFDDADWTKSCKYIQIGKTIICQLKLVSTTASPFGGAGGAVFTLPVTSTALVGTTNAITLGMAGLFDASAGTYSGAVLHTSTTTGTVFYHNQSTARFSNITTTTPFTWTSTDEIMATFTYEAA